MNTMQQQKNTYKKMTWNYYTVLPKGICCINEYEKEQHISTLEIFIHQ